MDKKEKWAPIVRIAGKIVPVKEHITGIRIIGWEQKDRQGGLHITVKTATGVAGINTTGKMKLKEIIDQICMEIVKKGQ